VSQWRFAFTALLIGISEILSCRLHVGCSSVKSPTAPLISAMHCGENEADEEFIRQLNYLRQVELETTIKRVRRSLTLASADESDRAAEEPS